MQKVTTTALLVSVLTLSTMSAANAGIPPYHVYNSQYQHYLLDSVHDLNSVDLLWTFGALYNVGMDVNQSIVDVITNYVGSGIEPFAIVYCMSNCMNTNSFDDPFSKSTRACGIDDIVIEMAYASSGVEPFATVYGIDDPMDSMSSSSFDDRYSFSSFNDSFNSGINESFGRAMSSGGFNDPF